MLMITVGWRRYDFLKHMKLLYCWSHLELLGCRVGHVVCWVRVHGVCVCHLSDLMCELMCRHWLHCCMLHHFGHDWWCHLQRSLLCNWLW